MENIIIDGRNFTAFEAATPNTKVLFIRGDSGFLGCGYFSLETADKVGDAAAIVTGVKSFDDMLAAPVKAVSAAAAARGVRPGMTGREALLLLA